MQRAISIEQTLTHVTWVGQHTAPTCHTIALVHALHILFVACCFACCSSKKWTPNKLIVMEIKKNPPAQSMSRWLFGNKYYFERITPVCMFCIVLPSMLDNWQQRGARFFFGALTWWICNDRRISGKLPCFKGLALKQHGILSLHS